MWGRFKLRYLKDPENELGKSEYVDEIVSKPFYKEAPRAYNLLSRMHYTLPQINAMLAYAKKTSYKAVARHFIASHPKLVKYWTTGKT